MDRSQRFATLTRIPEADAVQLAERIMDGSLGDVSVIVPPTVGMVMARMVDGAKGEVFNLGEVLVTEARVSIQGQEGWGMVMGGSPDHALAVAIVDAGIEAGHADGPAIESTLISLAVSIDAEAAAERQQLSSTLVQFDVF